VDLISEDFNVTLLQELQEMRQRRARPGHRYDCVAGFAERTNGTRTRSQSGTHVVG
jgi:hypothetical protein